MSDIVVTEDLNGGVISAKVGDALTIQLLENPTTGFRWALVTPDIDMFAQTGDGFRPDAQQEVGGGGLRVLRFLIKRQGGSKLEFKLARSWESGPPKRVLSVHINVS